MCTGGEVDRRSAASIFGKGIHPRFKPAGAALSASELESERRTRAHMTGQADFLAAVGDDFDLADGTSLRLCEVSDVHRQGDYRSYSLLFAGSLDNALAQASYELMHSTLGAQMLFLVPLGPGEEGFRYEAVFSYPADPEAGDTP